MKHKSAESLEILEKFNSWDSVVLNQDLYNEDVVENLDTERKTKHTWNITINTKSGSKFYDNLILYKNTKENKYFNEIYEDLKNINYKLTNTYIIKGLPEKAKKLILCDYDHYESELWPLMLETIDKWQPNSASFYSYYKKAVKFHKGNIINTLNTGKKNAEVITMDIEANEKQIFKDIASQYTYIGDKIIVEDSIKRFAKTLTIKQRLMLMNIIQYYENDKHYTFASLAEACGVNTKTVQRYMKEIKEKWSDYNEK